MCDHHHRTAGCHANNAKNEDFSCCFLKILVNQVAIFMAAFCENSGMNFPYNHINDSKILQITHPMCQMANSTV